MTRRGRGRLLFTRYVEHVAGIFGEPAGPSLSRRKREHHLQMAVPMSTACDWRHVASEMGAFEVALLQSLCSVVSRVLQLGAIPVLITLANHVIAAPFSPPRSTEPTAARGTPGFIEPHQAGKIAQWRRIRRDLLAASHRQTAAFSVALCGRRSSRL
ncbi:hypothetical protein MRX96_036224 [Rhipicephalus microplus]